MIVGESKNFEEMDIYDKVLDLFLKYKRECNDTIYSKKIDVVKLIEFLQNAEFYSSAVEKMKIIQNTLVLIEALFDEKYADYFNCIGKDACCLTPKEKVVLKREIISILEE